ncbi:MAG TPA: 16S rRNA (cytosine(967)-C(5))-methyltransferase RsmB [Oscillospiraceae bacterium]|nr:16S rRNA (cytosine(967)-C(5))-methyltransferase RsmB [Oscillospiraceae bacterium]
MSTAPSAREVALLGLGVFRRGGAWSDGYFKKAAASLDVREAALAARLFYGVLQNQALCDFYLDAFSTTPVRRMEDKVADCLRLGVYQLCFLDKIPQSAAVSESVSLARRYVKNPRAAGFVNAVLRGVARSADRLPEVPKDDYVNYLSVRYSHPRWLTEEFLALFGPEETEALLAADNAEAPMTIQRNPLRGSLAALEESLRSEGVETQPHPFLPDALNLRHTGDLESRAAFREGFFWVQDAAARMAVTAAGLRPGMRVLDACAAPGGKSFAAAADLLGQGNILACDIHPHKLRLIENGAVRLGMTCIETRLMDAREPDERLLSSFDAVIADVPCSGLGIIRKKPDIRYKDPGPLPGLPRVQRAIIDRVSSCVKPGGVLIYSTCTLLPRENGDVVRNFLAEHPDFAAEPFSLPVAEAERGEVTLLPHRHGTDGFYIAKLRRNV